MRGQGNAKLPTYLLNENKLIQDSSSRSAVLFEFEFEFDRAWKWLGRNDGSMVQWKGEGGRGKRKKASKERPRSSLGMLRNDRR